jgi:hypothetical protein
MVFNKVGNLKRDNVYFTLDFSADNLIMYKVDEFCNVYDGSCKEFYVKKTRDELYRESYDARGQTIVIDGIKYETFISFVDSIKFKINDGDERFVKKIKFKDDLTPLELIIFNSSLPGEGPIQRVN